MEELLLEFEGGAISSDPFMLFFTDFCSKLLEVLGLMWRFNIDVLVVSVFSSGQFSVKILISKWENLLQMHATFSTLLLLNVFLIWGKIATFASVQGFESSLILGRYPPMFNYTLSNGNFICNIIKEF